MGIFGFLRSTRTYPEYASEERSFLHELQKKRLFILALWMGADNTIVSAAILYPSIPAPRMKQK